MVSCLLACEDATASAAWGLLLQRAMLGSSVCGALEEWTLAPRRTERYVKSTEVVSYAYGVFTS